jgi:hypothetical protein
MKSFLRWKRLQTSEDREYAEALGKLSELNYRAGYEAGAAKNNS